MKLWNKFPNSCLNPSQRIKQTAFILVVSAVAVDFRGYIACCKWAKNSTALPFPIIYLFEAFFPEPSTSCLRPSVPSCSTVWVLRGSMGMVAALSGSFGIAAEAEGSNSREPLSLISDSMGTVESPAVPSSRPVLGSTAPEPDWRRKRSRQEQNQRKMKQPAHLHQDYFNTCSKKILTTVM